MRILVAVTTHCAICVAAAMLAGCGGGSGGPLSPSPAGVTAERTHVRSAYSVLYSFEGGSGDGEFPFAGLLNVNGTLYGTTVCWGRKRQAEPSSRSRRPGTETVLYSFKGGSSGDGTLPDAGLINVNGTLYGTTSVGGANDLGTVFAITTGRQGKRAPQLYRHWRRRRLPGCGPHRRRAARSTARPMQEGARTATEQSTQYPRNRYAERFAKRARWGGLVAFHYSAPLHRFAKTRPLLRGVLP